MKSLDSTDDIGHKIRSESLDGEYLSGMPFVFNLFFMNFLEFSSYLTDLITKKVLILIVNIIVLVLPPIVVYKDVLLLRSNIVYLFKNLGLNIYGGSITRRQKLSCIQERLATFLSISGLNNNAHSYQCRYKDKRRIFFTNPKYDKKFYKYMKQFNSSKNYHQTNTFIADFFEINHKRRF